MTLEEVYEDYKTDPAFNLLRMSGINFVPGYGKRDKPPFMFIGEAPGTMENAKRRPFVGKAGQKFNEGLKTIELTPDDVFTTNVVKYQPAKNRDPLDEEVEAGVVYLLREIEIVEPTLIVTMGRFAMNALIPDLGNITRNCNKVYLSPLTDTQVLPILHPMAVIYDPRNIPLWIRGFKMLGELLGRPG
jgi:DNA polymerase